MKSKIVFFLLFCINFSASITYAQQKTYANLSKRLVNAVRYDQDASAMFDSLAKVTPEVLAEELDTDDARKAFWINIYNSEIQYILKNNPKKFDERPGFFKEEQFVIAGESLSFEEVEHGIIRGSQWSLGLGIIPKLFVKKFERMMRTKKADPRIHFALNCGAKSCPPVAAYDYQKINQQLDYMSRQYLDKHASYNEEEGVVYAPKLMSWFSGDFGLCKKKKLKFLAKYNVLPPKTKAKIKFNEYDWTLMLDNYVTLE